MTVNEAHRRRGFWIRYTRLIPRSGVGHSPESALWAAYFDANDPTQNRAAKAAFPLAALQVERRPPRIRLGNAELDDRGCRGAVESDSCSFAWDLTWQPQATQFRFLPAVLQRLSSASQVATHPALKISGWFSLNGRRLEIDDAAGSQQHTFGSSHALEWNWAHAPGLSGSADSWFGGFSAVARSRPGVQLGGTTLGLDLSGHRWSFNSVRSILLGRRPNSVQEWRAAATHSGVSLRATVRPRVEDLIGVTYLDPQGDRRICYHAELADLHLCLERIARGHREVIQEIVQPAGAAFEYASRKPIAGLPVLI